MKKEILSRNGLTTFGMAQRVHEWGFQKDQHPRAQFHELMRLTKKWLEPQKNTAAVVVEKVVVDKYLSKNEAKKVVSQSNPVTAHKLPDTS